MITRLERSCGRVLGFTLSGKLHDADYHHFGPAVDAAVAAHGKIRMLAHFVDFHGWDMHALWDDTKFAVTHFTKVERIAIVGDRDWEKWMAMVCKPFTLADLRYFDTTQLEEAWAWIEEPLPEEPAAA
ncbi:STAS/SEC14 domain-containing protein [Prosthecobacter sp.]|uniref:STAS/SEC14 domain-containing protein n=1 Tax=Prosthecobacter sp. TaxID=1965333 RepID=UPI001DC43328|nr:STAS/SEC14 domain-containing protein [Prosthecobacter sp.]MCB1277773.1 STAS/SEC14 domain-containing protein [Prosthecobacter sp.]